MVVDAAVAAAGAAMTAAADAADVTNNLVSTTTRKAGLSSGRPQIADNVRSAVSRKGPGLKPS